MFWSSLTSLTPPCCEGAESRGQRATNICCEASDFTNLKTTREHGWKNFRCKCLDAVYKKQVKNNILWNAEVL